MLNLPPPCYPFSPSRRTLTTPSSPSCPPLQQIGTSSTRPSWTSSAASSGLVRRGFGRRDVTLCNRLRYIAEILISFVDKACSHCGENILMQVANDISGDGNGSDRLQSIKKHCQRTVSRAHFACHAGLLTWILRL